jgi:hypothetical protein
MPNNNDTSDLVDFVIESAQTAGVFVVIWAVILIMTVPTAIYVLRAAIVDPAVKQWNTSIPKLNEPAQVRSGNYFGLPKSKLE